MQSSRLSLVLVGIVFAISILPEDVSGGLWHKHWRRTEPTVQFPSPPGPLAPPLPVRQVIADVKEKVAEKVAEIVDPLVVRTNGGVVKGSEHVSRLGNKFLKFLAIPFAKPPVGKLRFESPQPADSWTGTLDATKAPPMCAQYEFIQQKSLGQDDCLYLNIYAPKRSKFDRKLPVVAIIHGGAFHLGTGTDYGGDYLVDENLIVVNFNYRLGALGFMDTSDGVVRGNMALKDQQLALKWIQNNIAHFGGDPDLVTLAGLSAGSMCANYHILSLKSKGLFSKAILQSGAAFGPVGLNHNTDNYKRFAAKFNCTNENNDTKATVDCLREIDAHTLVKGHNDAFFPYPIYPEAFFFPSIESVKDDDAFITEHPLDILKSGNYNKVPLMAGLSEKEMLLTIGAISGNTKESDEAAKDFESWSSRMLLYKKDAAIAKKIKEFYYKDDNTDNITTGAKALVTANMISDRIFNYGLYKFAKIHSANAPTFLYVNDFSPDFSIIEFFKLNQTFKGTTTHGDDAQLYAPHPLSPIPVVGSRMYNLSIDAVDLLAQFVNEDWMNFRTVPWWQVNPNLPKMKYLKIDDVPEMVDDPFDEGMKFWESLEGEIQDL